MTQDDVQSIFDAIGVSFPLYEEEVPNTYPIPFLYGWQKSADNMEHTRRVTKSYIESLRNTPPKSLYVGIPFCDTRSTNSKCRFCVYCTDHETKRTASDIGAYIDSIVRELGVYASKGVSFEEVGQLYIGGGTPSILTAKQARRLFAGIGQVVDLRKLRSVCFELEPSTTKRPLLEELQSQGVNRVSIGVQDWDDKVLRSQLRDSHVKDAEEAITLLNEMGFYYNVDLIYGLPGQSHERWLTGLRRLTDEFRTPEITLYRLRCGTQSDHKDFIHGDTLVARVAQKQLFARACGSLHANERYTRVRPCHWVSVDFLDRWRDYKFAPMSDLGSDAKGGGVPSQLGIGANAISHAGDTLVRNPGLPVYRTHWANSPSGDYEPLAPESFYVLNEDDRAARDILLRIESQRPIALDIIPKYCKRLHDFVETSTDVFRCVSDSNGQDEYALTEKGLVFYDYLELFFAHEITKYGKRVVFSTPNERKWAAELSDVAFGATDSQRDDGMPTCIELGAGVGALSIPIILHLSRLGIPFQWYAVDKNIAKLTYYAQALERNSWTKAVGTTGDLSPTLLPPLTLGEGHVQFISANIETEILFSGNRDIPLLPSKFDVVFMPSFLNHIVFRRRCLEFAWERLQPGGKIVLGYPSGAWVPAELGPSLHYDAGVPRSDDALGNLFRECYRIFGNWKGFFGRPLPDWPMALGHSLRVEAEKDFSLRSPSFEMLYQLLCEGDMSMVASSLKHRGYCDQEHLKFRMRQAFRSFVSAVESSDESESQDGSFRYSFQILSKRSEGVD